MKKSKELQMHEHPSSINRNGSKCFIDNRVSIQKQIQLKRVIEGSSEVAQRVTIAKNGVCAGTAIYNKINGKEAWPHFVSMLKTAATKEGLKTFSTTFNSNLPTTANHAKEQEDGTLYVQIPPEGAKKGYEKNVLIPLAQDVDDKWEAKPYAGNRGCVVDALAVVLREEGDEITQADVAKIHNDSTDSDGAKNEPYYMAGTDILYRQSGLRILWKYDPANPTTLEQLMEDEEDMFNGANLAVGLYKGGGAGHYVAIIDKKVISLQQLGNPWEKGTVGATPDFTDRKDYYKEYNVDYIYSCIV